VVGWMKITKTSRRKAMMTKAVEVEAYPRLAIETVAYISGLAACQCLSYSQPMNSHASEGLRVTKERT